jgi:hypothetical protein
MEHNVAEHFWQDEGGVEEEVASPFLHMYLPRSPPQNTPSLLLNTGYILNGSILNGYSLTGYVLNSRIPNGFILNGCIINGCIFNDCILNGYILNRCIF